MRLLGWEPYKRSLKYGVTLIPNSILLLPFAAVIVWLAYKFVEEKMSPLQKIQDDSVGVVQVSDWKCPEKKKGAYISLVPASTDCIVTCTSGFTLLLS